MDNAKIIDFATYREEDSRAIKEVDDIFPEDLITAIQLLIQRLRDDNPLQDVG